MQDYQHLFQPFRVKNVEFKNRIVMAPMATRLAAFGGQVTPQLLKYYSARALGGVGLVTVEGAAVSIEGKGWGSNLGIHDDKFLPGLVQLAEAIHQGGAKAGIQIYHAGRRAYKGVILQQPVAPSPIQAVDGEMPKELSVVEIERLIDCYAMAASRAKRAGFDIINLHIAHGYLLHQFLSPLSNKRTDLYGGDLEGRSRIIVEIISKIRNLVGDDFPLFCRLTGDEYASSGLTIVDAENIARILERAGADLIDVSAGGPDSPHKIVQPMTEPRGCLVHLAESIKKVVSIPVSVVGRINHPMLAEDILTRGQADLIVMGRPLIADPELPRKALQGKEDEIRPCIACNQGCLDRLEMGVSISCLVNPLAGREGMVDLKPALKLKRIVVVGGGVAGMQAAIVAAQRGHQVALLEKSDTLGGQALLAAKPPRKDEINNLVKYLITQLDKKGVSVKLGEECDKSELERLNPDEIIIATGALPIVPNFHGLNLKPVIFAWDVLKGTAKTGENVLIIGGGQVGCETAEYLLEQGKRVTVLEMGRKIAADMGSMNRRLLMQRLIDFGINVFTKAKFVGIDQETVHIDQLGVEIRLAGFDSIIFAQGAHSYNPIGDEVNNLKLHVVGDCSKPARFLDAIHAGFSIGNAL